MVRRRKGGAVSTRSQTRQAAASTDTRPTIITPYATPEFRSRRTPKRKRKVKAPSASAARLIKKGFSLRDASRIIASAAFHASSKAREKNPKLNKVKGMNNPHRYFFN